VQVVKANGVSSAGIRVTIIEGNCPVNNPWHRLPDNPPFVLPEDMAKVLAFNATAHENHVLHLDLIPEPFVGNSEAPVVLLGNNPGFKNPEAMAHKFKPAFANRMRNNLWHQLPDAFPFLYFDPDATIFPSHVDWWKRKLKCVLADFGNDDNAMSILARSIFAVEFFPYASHRFRHGWLKLPSQEYSFSLVRTAIKQDAVIVLTRGERRWLRRIPELAEYQRLVRLKEVQKAPISPNNCYGDGYLQIIRAIKARLQ
jgi:hypothetical protein